MNTDTPLLETCDCCGGDGEFETMPERDYSTRTYRCTYCNGSGLMLVTDAVPIEMAEA